MNVHAVRLGVLFYLRAIRLSTHTRKSREPNKY